MSTNMPAFKSFIIHYASCFVLAKFETSSISLLNGNVSSLKGLRVVPREVRLEDRP